MTEAWAATQTASVHRDTNLEKMGPATGLVVTELLTLARNVMEALAVDRTVSAHPATNLKTANVSSRVAMEFSTPENNATAARAAVRIASVRPTSNLGQMGPAPLLVVAPSVHPTPARTSAM